jgi:hypothetical protein
MFHFRSLFRQPSSARRAPGHRRRTDPSKATRRRPELEILEDRSLMSVSIGTPFAGVSAASSGSVPPDTIAAAGPNHVVEAVNNAVAIFNKSTGKQLTLQQMSNFFSTLGVIPLPAGSSQTFSDPVVSFDELSGRFVVGVLEYPTNKNGTITGASSFDFAVSTSSDPTLGFNFFRFNMEDRNGGGQFDFADFPRLGWNEDAYVVSFNMFPNNGDFDHVDTLSINKNNPNSFFRVVVPGGQGNFTLMPATMHGVVTGGPLWMVEAQNPTGGANSFTVVAMTNVLSSNPTFSRFAVGVPSYGAPPPATQEPPPNQPGTKVGQLDTDDARILNAAWRNNQLVAAHTTGSNGLAQARWYEFSTSGTSPTLLQSGSINPAVMGSHTYFPSIDIALNGDLGMTYMESSSNEFISMYVTGRTASDPLGTMETPVLAQAGQATYRGNPGIPTAMPPVPAEKSPFRAGDYSGISVDPAAPTRFWAANEFAANLAQPDNWGTAITPFSVTSSGSLSSGLSVSGYLLPASDSAVYRMDTDSNANQPFNVNLLPGDYSMVPSLQIYNGAGVLLRQIDGTLNALTGLFEIHTQLTATPNSSLFFVVRSNTSIPWGGFSFHLSASRSPVASNGSYSLPENSWLQTDATTGVLKFASDPDGLLMRAELITGPTNGSLNGGFNSDGSFWYIPNHNFMGTDQLTYRVSDANGLSSIATVQINVTPLAPTAPDLTYNVLTGQARAANLLTGNTDPQGLTLQAVLISGFGFPVALPLGQPLRLSHGSLTSFDASGNFVYTPDAGYHGTDSFRYAVADSLFPFTVTITPTATVTLVIGHPPVAGDLVYFVDPNHTLTVDAASGLVGSNLQTTAHLVDPAPRGLTLHGDGSFVYHPPAGRRHFELTFSYYLTNPDGTSNIATVTIQVGDDDPGPR